MASLDAAADKAVRDAVDAFMEGQVTPDFAGETVFETKNSRYQLLDGVVFVAPDDALIGAELVGWLIEAPHASTVESAWQTGARAVLVDRHRERTIIVTSTIRLLHLQEHAPRDPNCVAAGRIAQFPPRRSSVPPSVPPRRPDDAMPTVPPTRQLPVRAVATRANGLHWPPRPSARMTVPPPPARTQGYSTGHRGSSAPDEKPQPRIVETFGPGASSHHDVTRREGRGSSDARLPGQVRPPDLATVRPPRP